MTRRDSNKGPVLENFEFNLCDFELFLSVMKNKQAHEIILSILMDDPDLQLEEIHVEEVVLNKSKKRAIRLDAWAKDSKGNQYNTEMQNDATGDDVRKRSRFYQGLIDTPILKSGKETKYKQLPSTAIIFITKEDIFGKDLVKYTFTEQCEEVEGFHLDDGTMKIFLNMSSRNGPLQLVSLLQYMKKTSLDNPEVLTQDDRMKKLDAIVNEVKESEEMEEVSMRLWEAAQEAGIKMGIERGEEIGKEIGKETNRIEMICKKLRKGKSAEVIAEELEEEIAVIEKICIVAAPFAPEYDSDKIVEEWLMEKNK